MTNERLLLPSHIFFEDTMFCWPQPLRVCGQQNHRQGSLCSQGHCEVLQQPHGTMIPNDDWSEEQIPTLFGNRAF